MRKLLLFSFAIIFSLAFAFKAHACVSGNIPSPSPDVTCPTSWNAYQNLAGSTPSSPSIQNLGNTLIIAVRGANNFTYVKEWDVSTNSLAKDWYAGNNGKSPSSPKLILNSGTLYIYVQGMDGNVYYSAYQSPGAWSAWTNTGICNNNFGTTGPTSVTANDGNIYGASGNSPIYLNKCEPAPQEYKPLIGSWYSIFYHNKTDTASVGGTNDHWSTEVRLHPVLGNYSSGDPNVISAYFKQLHDLGISFIILDDTNGINNDKGLIEKNFQAIFNVADSMPANERPQIAISIGVFNDTAAHRTQAVSEANYVYNTYANRPSY